jgi:hypothetical protein
MKYLQRKQKTITKLNGRHLFRDMINLETLYNLEAEAGENVQAQKEHIQDLIDTEMDVLDAQMPPETIHQAVLEAENDLAQNIEQKIDTEIIEAEFDMTKEEIQAEASRIAEKIENQKEGVKDDIEKKAAELQHKLQEKGIDGLLVEQYKKSENAMKNAIREIVVGSLKEDIDKKTGGVQPDGWVQAQAEIAYNRMSAQTMLMYLSYVGAKRTIQLPGTIYDGSKEAWNNVSQFLEDSYKSAGETLETVGQEITDFFTPDPAEPNPTEVDPMTEEEKTFWRKLRELPEKLYTKLANDEKLQPIWDYFNENYKELHEVPEGFRNASWFNPDNIAPAALIGVYLSTFMGDAQNPNAGSKNMILMAALFGGAASVEKITVPVLDSARALLLGTGRILGDGLGILWRAGMSFPRDRSRFGVFTNWEYALDGKWHSTRQQESIMKALHNIDEQTKDMVPDEISDLYDKILQNENQNIDSHDVSNAAEFCAKSLDKGVFLTEMEAKAVQGKLLEAGTDKWKDIDSQNLVRMLNTAYQKRIVTYFLGLPDGDPNKTYFKERFSEILAERKIKQAQEKMTGIKMAGFDKLDLNKMYEDKIDFQNINEVQRKGVFGDVFQNKNVLGTIGMPILMLYLLFTGVLQIKELADKNSEDKAAEKIQKSADELSPKNQQKLSKLLESPAENKKKILKFLKKHEILHADKDDKDKYDLEFLENMDEDVFAEAMDKGNLRNSMGGSLAVLASSFALDIDTVADEIAEWEAFQKENQNEVAEERLRRAIERGTSVPELTINIDNGEEYKIKKVYGGLDGDERLENGWENFTGSLGLTDDEKDESIFFQGEFDGTHGRFALIQKGEDEYLHVLGGANDDLQSMIDEMKVETVTL